MVVGARLDLASCRKRIDGSRGSHLVRTWEKNVGSLGTKSDAAQEGSVGGCRLGQV